MLCFEVSVLDRHRFQKDSNLSTPVASYRLDELDCSSGGSLLHQLLFEMLASVVAASDVSR